MKSEFKNDNLYIAGTGELENYLKNKYKFEKSIIFLGFIEKDELISKLKKIDCIIIPSPEESGPLVGVEAMCAAKLIITTRVGSMPERLNKTSSNFCYDYNDYDSFKTIFNAVKSMIDNEVHTNSKKIRTHYLENYALEIIEKKYLSLIKIF